MSHNPHYHRAQRRETEEERDHRRSLYGPVAETIRRYGPGHTKGQGDHAHARYQYRSLQDTVVRGFFNL